MMEMGSRGGAPGAETELSNQGILCSLNTLDAPAKRRQQLCWAVPPQLGIAPLGLQLLMQSRHIFGCSINNNSESGMAVF